MPAPEIAHSIAAAASVADWSASRWDIGTLDQCELVRSYVNEVYKLTTDRGQFALKIFRRSWRNRRDAVWEAQLCVHLDAHGVPLAAPLAGIDREHVQLLTYPEGERAAILTPWLAGSKPEPPWTDGLYRDFGRAAARMHLASATFVPGTPGRLLNSDHLIRRPVSRLRERFRDRPETYQRLLDASERIASDLDVLTPQLPFGVCQGDLTLDNLHILSDGDIAFYDFDLGGHGWFAFDFAFFDGWLSDDSSKITLWNAFRAGYGEIREITTLEIRALPLFNAAYKIWDLEHTIRNWTDWSGAWQATPEKVTSMIESILDHTP